MLSYLIEQVYLPTLQQKGQEAKFQVTIPTAKVHGKQEARTFPAIVIL